ncbi:hypothetical protein TanjilG_08801 [Lupinus angustifolius]|uniref:Uncharacterized protein n=1 Tax=Lupinus angustifolius TaxID=3871 RepID=A0A4P1RPC1_LUPAN|nr:hypothetical protein TanjilG_08801 [Lupinus angustifolius]
MSSSLCTITDLVRENELLESAHQPWTLFVGKRFPANRRSQKITIASEHSGQYFDESSVFNVSCNKFSRSTIVVSFEASLLFQLQEVPQIHHCCKMCLTLSKSWCRLAQSDDLMPWPGKFLCSLAWSGKFCPVSVTILI